MGERPPLLITPEESNRQYLHDLLAFREFFLFLVWRDILVRYKQTFFGVLWALFRPLLNMVAFTFVFGKFAGLPSGDIPYSLYVLVGLLPWHWFAGSIQDANLSLLVQSSLLTKVYFPRAFLPLSLVILNGMDFCVGLLLFFPWIVWQGLSWSFLLFPLFVLQCGLLSAALALFFSSMTVYYRDFKIVVPFFLQLGLFLSPVGYSSSLVPEAYRWLFAMNPLVGIIDGFRFSLLGGSSPLCLWHVLISWCMIICLLSLSFRTFRRWERHFADVI